jgi:16S rRNA (cytosine967-C5)-methyltransferase
VEQGMDEKIVTRIIAKYLRKGNMARCLRDILPSAGLSKEQREEIAVLVHDVVRWKKLYEQIIERHGLEPTPETYVKLALDGAQADVASYPFEYRYSCSPYVTSILTQHSDWAEYLNQNPPTNLCVNFNKSTVHEVIKLLQTEYIPAKHSLLDTSISTTSVSKYSKAVQQRFAHVQDENSQFIAALAVYLGNSILDYCAGNGGKSLAMASISKNTKHLTAYEVNPGKQAILRQRCSEYNANVTVKEHQPNDVYDLVLVDAPCSGLGAARRNPEAKYIEGPGEFPATQLTILKEAAQNVQNKGFLLYAVCTITPEETTQVIHSFTKNHEFTNTSLNSVPHADYLQHTKDGAFTVLPQGDLFFVSLLKKK